MQNNDGSGSGRPKTLRKKILLAEKDHWSNISGSVKRDILVLKGGDPDHTAAAVKGQISLLKSTSGPSVILSVLKSTVRLLCPAIESFDQCSEFVTLGSCSFLQWLSRCKIFFFSKNFLSIT